MENFYRYLEGFQIEDKKREHPAIYLFTGVLSLLTMAFGFMAIFISLSRGKNLSSIYDKAPVVVILSFSCIPLFLLSILFYFLSSKRKKENEKWRKIRVYPIDTDEAFVYLWFKKDAGKLYFDASETLVLDENELVYEELDSHLKLCFTLEGKEYYILTDKEYIPFMRGSKDHE